MKKLDTEYYFADSICVYFVRCQICKRYRNIKNWNKFLLLYISYNQRIAKMRTLVWNEKSEKKKKIRGLSICSIPENYENKIVT